MTSVNLEKRIEEKSFRERAQESIHPFSISARYYLHIVETEIAAREKIIIEQKERAPHHFFQDAFVASALSLAYIGVGREFDAEELMKNIKDFPSTRRYSALMVAAFSCVGKIEEAKRLMQEVKAASESGDIPERTILFGHTFSLAHTAVGEYKKVEEIVREISTKPPYVKIHRFRKGDHQCLLLNNANSIYDSSYYSAYTNLTLAISMYFLKQVNEARAIVNGVTEEFGYDYDFLTQKREPNKMMYAELVEVALLSFDHSLVSTEEHKEEGIVTGHPYR